MLYVLPRVTYPSLVCIFWGGGGGKNAIQSKLMSPVNVQPLTVLMQEPSPGCPEQFVEMWAQPPAPLPLLPHRGSRPCPAVPPPTEDPTEIHPRACCRKHRLAQSFRSLSAALYFVHRRLVARDPRNGAPDASRRRDRDNSAAKSRIKREREKTREREKEARKHARARAEKARRGRRRDAHALEARRREPAHPQHSPTRAHARMYAFQCTFLGGGG